MATNDQGDLFAPPTGDQLRDDGMRRAEEHAADLFLDDALLATYNAAVACETLTTDDVWERTTVKTHENKALGPVMKEAQRRGYITPTPDFRPTRRPEGHSSPKRVWRSLIYGR